MSLVIIEKYLNEKMPLFNLFHPESYTKSILL